MYSSEHFGRLFWVDDELEFNLPTVYKRLIYDFTRGLC